MRLVPVPKRLLVDVYEALVILRGYATGGSPPEWDPVVDEAREGLERALRAGVDLTDDSEEWLQRLICACRAAVEKAWALGTMVPPKVSEVCRRTHVQSCHVCEDLVCVDNMSPAKKLQGELATVKERLEWKAKEYQGLSDYVAKVEDENAALLAELGPYRSGACHACNVEAALGTEECPHPVDGRVHTCDRNIEVDLDAVIAPWPRHLTCGCVTCVCEDPVRCHGCGAKLCSEHARRGP